MWAPCLSLSPLWAQVTIGMPSQAEEDTVNTTTEAAAAVAACRDPPFGRRSAGWLRHPSGSDDVRVVEDVAVILMVETVDGLANCGEIAAVPGVDCVYVGPFDLALALGLPLVDRTADQVRIHTDAIKVRRACYGSTSLFEGTQRPTSSLVSSLGVSNWFLMSTVLWTSLSVIR